MGQKIPLQESYASPPRGSIVFAQFGTYLWPPCAIRCLNFSVEANVFLLGSQYFPNPSSSSRSKCLFAVLVSVPAFFAIASTFKHTNELFPSISATACLTFRWISRVSKADHYVNVKTNIWTYLLPVIKILHLHFPTDEPSYHNGLISRGPDQSTS